MCRDRVVVRGCLEANRGRWGAGAQHIEVHSESLRGVHSESTEMATGWNKLELNQSWWCSAACREGVHT